MSQWPKAPVPCNAANFQASLGLSLRLRAFVWLDTIDRIAGLSKM